MNLKSYYIFALAGLIVLLFAGKSFAQNKSDLLPIVENNLWGFIDTKGNIVIKPQFIGVGIFSDGLAVVELESGKVTELSNGKKEYISSKYGYIDTTGKIILRVPFDQAEDFVGGFAPVRVGDKYDDKYWYPGKYGFIDKTGKLIVEPQFDQVSNTFSEGLMAVKIGEKWGFIDTNRKISIPVQFSDVEPFSEGLAAAKKGKKWGYIDKTGKFVIKPQFARAQSFSDGLAQINLKMYGEWGYIDKTGNIVIPAKYNSAGNFTDGKASVSVFQNNKSMGYCINKKGENLPLEECNCLPEKYIISKTIDGKKVFVDETGKILFDNKWDFYKGFYKGVALVFNADKNHYNCGLYVPGWTAITDACFNWGYIDETGKYIWKQPELN